jgi:hypothetical protein
MSAGEDIGLDAKRVFEGDRRETTIYVASGTGVLAVSVAGARVGEFSLVERCTARDVATGPGGVAVATSDGVRVATSEDGSAAGDAFRDVGFLDHTGGVDAVAFHGADVLAATGDGAIARYRDGDWTELESLPGVSGMDGDLVASDRGVYRVREDGLRHVGLASAVDVAAAGIPLAATVDGLHQLGNGWLEVAAGAFTFVTADPGAADGALGRAHAGTDEALYAHHDGEWTVETRFEQPAVDVAYGDSVYAVSADGVLAAEAPDDWRHQDLGVRDVTAAASALDTQ